MATEYKAQWRDAGQTLLHAREGLKLSRKQVAEKIGYKVGTIRAWEGGFSRPSPEAIAKLNEVYGMLPLAPPASAEIPPEPTEPGGFPPDSSAAPHEPVGPSFGGGSRQDRLAMCYDFIGMGARLMIPSDDPRGQKLPTYIAQLAEHLATEQAGLLGELESLKRNLEKIAAMQQEYSKLAGVADLAGVTPVFQDMPNHNQPEQVAGGTEGQPRAQASGGGIAGQHGI